MRTTHTLIATALLSLTAAATLATAQVQLPQYSRAVLPNGMTLLLAPRKDVPLVSVRLLVRGGAESDPAAMSGLSDVTAELLRRGTTKRTADQFAEALDSLGADFATGSSQQATDVEMEFLAKDATAALELLADAVIGPAFPEAEVKKVLEEQIDSAKSVKDEPRDMLRRYTAAMIFGPKHPYGRVADELSLAGIQREHIVAHHKRYFGGRNIIAAVVGDFETAAMRKAMETAFAAMPPGEAFSFPAPLPSPLVGAKARLLLIDKPDATQTYFAIAMPGIARTDPNRVGLWLVNTLFGERFTSMLNEELRVNSGLTYGASSRVQLNRLPGAIVLSSFTKTESTVAAIDLALAVVGRLRTKGIDALQMASTKAYVKGTYPVDNLETNGQLATVLGDLELFGQNRGEVDDLFSRIGAVTAGQATALARQYYQTANLQFCLVGKAADIRDKVAKYAPGAMAVIPATEPGVRVADGIFH